MRTAGFKKETGLISLAEFNPQAFSGDRHDNVLFDFLERRGLLNGLLQFLFEFWNIVLQHREALPASSAKAVTDLSSLAVGSEK